MSALFREESAKSVLLRAPSKLDLPKSLLTRGLVAPVGESSGDNVALTLSKWTAGVFGLLGRGAGLLLLEKLEEFRVERPSIGL
jgi:hypothetical protein